MSPGSKTFCNSVSAGWVFGSTGSLLYQWKGTESPKYWLADNTVSSAAYTWIVVNNRCDISENQENQTDRLLWWFWIAKQERHIIADSNPTCLHTRPKPFNINTRKKPIVLNHCHFLFIINREQQYSIDAGAGGFWRQSTGPSKSCPLWIISYDSIDLPTDRS